jgi:hypothetical protein
VVPAHVAHCCHDRGVAPRGAAHRHSCIPVGANANGAGAPDLGADSDNGGQPENKRYTAINGYEPAGLAHIDFAARTIANDYPLTGSVADAYPATAATASGGATTRAAASGWQWRRQWGRRRRR